MPCLMASGQVLQPNRFFKVRWGIMSDGLRLTFRWLSLRLTFIVKKMENMPCCQMLQATRGAAISQSGAPDLVPHSKKFLVMSSCFVFLPRNEIKIGKILHSTCSHLPVKNCSRSLHSTKSYLLRGRQNFLLTLFY